MTYTTEELKKQSWESLMNVLVTPFGLKQYTGRLEFCAELGLLCLTYPFLASDTETPLTEQAGQVELAKHVTSGVCDYISHSLGLAWGEEDLTEADIMGYTDGTNLRFVFLADLKDSYDYIKWFIKATKTDKLVVTQKSIHGVIDDLSAEPEEDDSFV